MKERDTSLDAVKGFAIVLVMLGHCIVKNNMVDATKDPYVYDVIKAIEMPLFIMISGYLAGLSKKVTGLKAAGAVIKKRAISYLVPFFVWIFISNLLSGSFTPIQALKDVLFHLDWGLWFLMTLFIITVLVLLADCFPKFRQWAFFLILAYGGFLIQSRSGNTFLSPHLTIRYMPYYMLGFMVSRYLLPLRRNGHKLFVKLTEKKVLWALWGVSLVGFLYLIIAFDMVTVHSGIELLAQMTASLLGSFLCFFGVYELFEHRRRSKETDGTSKIPFQKTPLLSRIGLYTLEIYVLHFRFVQMLGFYKKGYSLYSPEGICVVAVSFVVMSIFTWVIVVLVKKVPVLNFLLFGKSRPRR